MKLTLKRETVAMLLEYRDPGLDANLAEGVQEGYTLTCIDSGSCNTCDCSCYPGDTGTCVVSNE